MRTRLAFAVACALMTVAVIVGVSPAPAATGRPAGVARTGWAGLPAATIVPGTPAPIPMSPSELLLKQVHDEWDNERNPEVPVDSAATVRTGAPLIPSSQPAAGGDVQPDAPGDFRTFALSDLGGTSTSQVNEPTAAGNGGGAALATWNWYAARSENNGSSWTYMDPRTAFPNSYGGFCCDQLSLYEPSRDIFIWVLQYVADAGGNGIRIAVANGASDLASGSFHYWTIRPQDAGGGAGQWFDLPKIAVSNNYLWMSVSEYNQSSSFTRSLVLNFSLSTLASGGSLGFSYFDPGHFSPALTQGATGSMWFMVHRTNAQMRLFRWDEGSGSIYYSDVNHTSFPSPNPHSCQRSGGSSNSDWCRRGDARMQAAWQSGSEIGVMFNAGQGNGGFGSFPYPYIHIVRMNTSFGFVSDTAIWNGSFAFRHASIAPNSIGDLGGTFLWGGGSERLNCGAMIRDGYTGSGFGLYSLTYSNTDTTSPVGGDYLSARIYGAGSRNWVGSCYQLVGGTTAPVVHPWYVVFGREGTAPPPAAPTNLSAAPGPGRGQISLTWDPANDNGSPIQYYNVHRNGSLIATTSDTSYTDGGLGDGATYGYAVSAVNGGGTGPLSNTVTATTYHRPDPPEDLVATATLVPGTIYLSWNPAPGGQAQRYDVCRDEGVWVCFDVGDVTSYSDSGRSPIAQVTYHVRAVNEIGISDPSNTACAYGSYPMDRLLSC